MSKILSYAALAALLSVAGPALAQSAASHAAATPPAQSMPPTTSSPSSAAPGSTSAPPPTTSAPSSAAPGSASPPSATAPTGTDAAASAGASTTLTTGMSVKDNTGALIGEVKSIKGGLATIQMGSDTFTVESSKLGVQGGAATINATQAQLKSMLPKK